MPTYPVKIIKRYLGRTPETVVDLGCGTGLSTLVFDDIEKFKKRFLTFSAARILKRIFAIE